MCNPNNIDLTADKTTPTISTFKCKPCQRRRLKCDMTMPTCKKCIKRGMECVYVYKPPRVRRQKDESYQAYVNKFSTKDDQDCDIGFDAPKFNHNGSGTESSESIITISPSPSKGNYDMLVDLNVENELPNDFELKSNIVTNHVVESNCFITNYMELLPYSLSSPTYSSGVRTPFNQTSEEELTSIAQNLYFKNVNSTFILFPITSSQRWRYFNYISSAVTALGLLYLPSHYEGFESLKCTLEEKLLSDLSNNYATYSLETLQFYILCYQIILLSNSLSPCPFPILTQLGTTCLNQAKATSEYFKSSSPNLVELSRSNPFFSLELNAALDLLTSFEQ